jgi:hypothetical protein
MIFLFIVFAVLSLVFLPWWMLIAVALVYGFVSRARWMQAFFFAAVVGVHAAFFAYYFNHQMHGLVGERVAGVLGAPEWAVIVIPVVIGVWISLFFSRLGSAVRVLTSR